MDHSVFCVGADVLTAKGLFQAQRLQFPIAIDRGFDAEPTGVSNRSGFHDVLPAELWIWGTRRSGTFGALPQPD